MLSTRSRLIRGILIGMAALVLVAGAAYASQAVLGPQTDQNVQFGGESDDPSASPEDDGAVDDVDEGDVEDADDGAANDTDEVEVEDQQSGENASPEESEAPEASDDAEDD